MDLPYRLCYGMGGLRTAGDLVARAQLYNKAKLNDAKKLVADKLGIDVEQLSDEFAMRDVREEHDIGLIIALPGRAKGIAAKKRISKLFGFQINSVNLFDKKTVSV